MLLHENEAKQNGFRFIVGIDEAGRGPLAGPVVAAAVCLRNLKFKSRIDDSKKLTPQERSKAYFEIFKNSYVGIGVMSEVIIDNTNILIASHLAMAQAARQLIGTFPNNLRQRKDFNKRVCLLVDGNLFRSDLPYAYKTIIKGDASSLSIACASIVAKVYRDRILNIYDSIFPSYAFGRHKGYPTLEHRRLLQELGPSPIHRKTFHVAAV